MMNKVNALTFKSADFPEPLSHIPSPPKTIYWTGSPPSSWLKKPKVAIVGSRKVSAYGREVTQRLSGELSGYGIVVISGLALGVDSIAHQAALDAGAITVAILPTDLGRIYPASHSNLARRIVEQGGTLISEYPVGSQAYRVNFIARNRIVSGLADVLLITEAAAASGTMHTAGFALEQGKTVMAVPGNITSPGCEGTNNLIKSGALPATSVNDVLLALKISPKDRTLKTFRGTPQEEKVLALIRRGTSPQEEIAVKLRLSAQDTARILTMLEIEGYIQAAGGGQWSAI